MTRSAWSGRRT